MTLVELMVVVVIIAIIAGIALTLYQDVQKKARLAADNGSVSAMRSSVAIYYGNHNGNFPPTLSAVNAMTVPQPSWQCTANIPPTYDTTNGKLTFTATLADC